MEEAEEATNPTLNNKSPGSEGGLGISRLVLDDTMRQLHASQLRIGELRIRLQELLEAKMKEEDPTSATSLEEIKKRVEEKRTEETKVLRRLYLLIKQFRPKLQSECLLRVAEVISQNGTIQIDNEAVERLSPFNAEQVVRLLKQFIA